VAVRTHIGKNGRLIQEVIHFPNLEDCPDKHYA
jgi:hypothetical protein